MENVNETNINENEQMKPKQSKQTKKATKQTKSNPKETESESKPKETEPEEHEIEDISEDVFYEKGVYTAKTNAEIFSEMAEELTDSINSRRPSSAKKSSSGLTLKSVASMAAAAIPVVAGILYLKDRKKSNADTSSAFTKMGNGNF